VISLTAEFLTDDPVTWQVASTRSGFLVQRATDDRALFGAIGAVQQNAL
jgi:hypothetical protein